MKAILFSLSVLLFGFVTQAEEVFKSDGKIYSTKSYIERARDFVDICDRGAIGAEITHYTASEDCSKVEKKDLESINILAVFKYGRGGKVGSDLSGNILKGMTSLESLELNGHDIEVVGAEVFSDAKNLKTIGLHNNKISYIEDGAFKDLVYLEVLDLHGNMIDTVSKSRLGLSDSVLVYGVKLVD